MLKPNLAIITQFMRRAVDRLQQEGAVKPREGRIVRLEEVFPFIPADVDGIYHTQGGGATGVRFCLKNGRVYDDSGQLSEVPRDAAPGR